MSDSSLDQALECSGIDLLGSAGERRRPTHGRQGKKALPSGAPMWLVHLDNSPTSLAAPAGVIAIFFNTINDLNASAPNSRIHDHDAR